MNPRSQPYFAGQYVKAQRKAYNKKAMWWNRVRAGIEAYVLGAALRGYPISSYDLHPGNVYKDKPGWHDSRRD